ncbi:TAT-variant-translocated molybdopterin oxidoreductase [Adhaeribacter rhizoryzae]|uniref:4Fe-4S dicluster domain-containing protein n=1 Tax=Adhaeribacter rhizoryzae TaxID=2607907 RepID=A0A5M6DQ03_9BACT|nr:TAT-variant-translocated molybdopterin oxidoreductase [Adhaeribacter rhizoryzae]KAA5549578.1 4Fe-4S dicluster domain-containing protein [Adhaeribacter rhizoryzae]
MQETIKYWKGLEELENTPEFVKNSQNEFAEFLPVKDKSSSGKNAEVAPRRDFLKLLGFSVAAATLASCEAPVRKAIPYLNKPEEIEPGIANWYASTYFTDGDYNSILVKTREGRPIKIEGNPLSSLTRGGLSPRGQATVLSLYDTTRLPNPVSKRGEKHIDADWEQIDQEIRTKLGQVNGKVALVSTTVISPSTRQVIREFGAKYPAFEHVVYDPYSVSGLLKANGGVIPGYDFSKAKTIVSFGADFLGAWLSQVEFAKQYITNRKVTKDNPNMSRHYQFEATLSLTGANADVRVPIKPSEEGVAVAALYNRIAQGTGGQVLNTPAFAQTKQLDAAVKDLLANRGASLVVSGSNDVAVQSLVREINRMLGSEGTTINTAAPIYIKQGDDTQMIRFINEMNAGTVGAVIFYNANPVYNHPLADKVVSGLKKVGVKISFADRIDETAALADYITPDHHPLESWNDFEPRKGYLSLSQPTISPLFKTRQAQDSLLAWSGSRTSYYDYLRNNWRANFVKGGDFNTAWDKAVHDGVLEGVATPGQTTTATAAPLTLAAAAVAINQTSRNTKGIELAIYQKSSIGSGVEANNPWLQELSDPISRATWDNYLAIPRSLAKEMEIEQNDVIQVTAANGKTIELPALIQPGQARNTVAIAVGYGRTHAGPVANQVGVNVYPLAATNQNGVLYINGVTLKKTGAEKVIAQTQTHHTIMDRNVVQEASLDAYRKNPKEVTEYIKVATPDGPQTPSKVSLWYDYEYKNHHWGMVIDLNSCIGCGSCVVGCASENNTPIVGKQEVLNRREMFWMRIDRYYSSDTHKDTSDLGTIATYQAMEEPSENPQVIFQPMLCQHCNHAPCETVCPVLATTHSSEGLNQMTYNRCVGTRYCANNCPYKVRRFNWFAYYDNEKFATQNYQMNSDLGRMVLNPDVTVRGRGVIEKCSFCVQRIQAGKLEAKKDKRRPKDGEIVTACAQSCPTNAIIFGDMKDPNSQITQILRREDGERAFHVLEELNVQPNVTYLTKIRNNNLTTTNA